MDRVSESLKELSELREQRSKIYGDVSKTKGEIFNLIFPNGITLKTPLDHERYSILSFIFSKLIRYSNNFNDGGHEDSLNDISVYSQMLKESDRKLKNEK